MPDCAIVPLVGNAAARCCEGRVENLLVAIWDITLGLLVDLALLQRHAKELKYWMDKLEDLEKDVTTKTRRALKKHTEMAARPRGWRKRVADLSREATDFERSFNEPFCITGFCLVYDVRDLLRRVKRLHDEGSAIEQADQFVNPRGPEAVKLVHCDISGSDLVGRQDILRRIKGYITEDQVGVIGIHGEAKVGKTSILQIINNEFLFTEARNRFDTAIWVDMSQEEVISSIQKTIAKRLEVTLPSETPVDTLFEELCGRRFILLLDDVCEKLDLKRIGIPPPRIVGNRSKILFTTRSKDVCHAMRADRVETVGMLDAERSWDLFHLQFDGSSTADFLNDPAMQPQARKIVDGCGGKPTLLIDAGKKMAMARTTNDLLDVINRWDLPAAEPSQGTGSAPHS